FCNGVAIDLRRVDVSSRSANTRGAAFCPRLSDQNCAAPFITCLCLLLAVARQSPRIPHSRGDEHDRPVARAAPDFSNVVCQERARLRKLLGNVGNNLLPSANGTPGV